MHTEQIKNIEKELENYESELYECSAEYRHLATDAATKRAAYDVRWAQELLKIATNKDLKLTVPEKEAMVTTLVQDELSACRIAEAMASGSKERLKALQANLTSVQTRASLLKTARSLVNMMS